MVTTDAEEWERDPLRCLFQHRTTGRVFTDEQRYRLFPPPRPAVEPPEDGIEQGEERYYTVAWGMPDDDDGDSYDYDDAGEVPA